MSFTDYHDLEVWISAKDLAVMVYKVSDSFPPKEIYGITSQMRRSAVSISSNIAEGVGRSTVNDTMHFLYIARGSLFELDTQLQIALEIGIMNKPAFDTINEKLTSTKRRLNGFINYYKSKK